MKRKKVRDKGMRRVRDKGVKKFQSSKNSKIRSKFTVSFCSFTNIINFFEIIKTL